MIAVFDADQVRKWIIDWNLNTEKKHTLLRLLYEALVDCKKRYTNIVTHVQFSLGICTIINMNTFD